MEKAARRAREHPAVLLAAGAMALSGALLLHWFSRITFWRDEWGFLLTAGARAHIPPDQASVPWRLVIRSGGRITSSGLAA